MRILSLRTKLLRRTATAVIAASIACAGLVAGGATASAQDHFPNIVWFADTISPYACLTANGSNRPVTLDNGNCDDTKSDFDYVANPNGVAGTVLIKQAPSDTLCLDSAGAKTSIGTVLVMAPCKPSSRTQAWAVPKAQYARPDYGGGAVSIIQSASNLVVQRNSATQLVLAAPSDGSPAQSQIWNIDPSLVSVPAYLQRSVDTQCATPAGQYNGALLTLGNGCNFPLSLPSAFVFIGASQYGWGELRDAVSGKCLDTDYGNTGNGTSLVLGACDWMPTQLWSQTSLSDGSGRFYLVNNGSAKVIDTANGAGTPGTPLVIGTFTGSATQLWKWDTTG